jgi:hypothetical protein
MNKTLFALVFSILATFSLKAQQLPNASFETWAGSGNIEKPDNWNQLNASLPSSVAIFVPKTCHKTTPGHTGTYCAKLETVNVSIQGPTNGVLTTGNIITSPPYGVDGGLNYPYRPDSLVGWYKSSPAATDLGTVEITLLDASLDTVGRGKFFTPSTAVSSWTRFAVKIDYYLPGTPDKAITLASSSDGFNAVVGSLLWVDDLELIFNPLSIDENEEIFVPVYSNNALVYVNLLGMELENPVINYYSIDGKLLLTQNLTNNSLNSFYSGFAEGIYIYSIQHGDKISSGKIALR